ncbi:hypothetical protein HLK59_01040 [Streptomyces sp. S3(2020)]|uniref:hypothetical protein n=1 Tax=Streptomyces sp. S3(2020) TaxID=2732044 RepID=UPI0014892AF2|nr:hypothetical protein [Streptomyces sp. S3(2020)]NNN28959.1 hypothetical protein [Streptomyces sp. S3(2020)]
MLSGLSQAAGKALGGARFTLVSVLPAAVLTGYVTALIMTGAYSGGGIHVSRLADDAKDHPEWLAFAAFACLLVGLLLRPFQVALVQMLEGYWQGRALPEAAGALATERHRRRLHTAEVVSRLRVLDRPGTKFTDVVPLARRRRRAARIAARADRLVLRYPTGPHPVPHANDGDRDRLMPTMLGNILREAEDESGRRYGLDLPTVSHRLSPQLSPSLTTAINQQLDLLDTTCALSVCFGLATLAGTPLVGRLDAWSLAPVVTALLSIAAYRGAMQVATGHRQLLAAAFDLHRFDMLTALHLKPPDTPEEEHEQNTKLTRFFASPEALAKEDLLGVVYKHPDPAPGGPASGPSGQGDDSA